MKSKSFITQPNRGYLTTLRNSLIWITLAALFPLVLTTTCRSVQKVPSPHQRVEIQEESDSLTYELIVLDPAYESFLIGQPSEDFYAQHYYETWNQQYVLEWNRRHQNPLRYGAFYETEIDYQSTTNYGLTLNYRLYYFFRFIQKQYGITLIDRGR